MKQKILIIIIFVAIVSFIFSYNKKDVNLNPKTEIYKTICGEYRKGEVKIGLITLLVDVADNNCKLNLGLSNRISLSETEGMIFVPGYLGGHRFWMKDMNFSLDILWIDDNFIIIGIEKNLLPSTFPKSYGENYFAKYVLEIPAGNSDKNNIKVGDRVVFSKK